MEKIIRTICLFRNEVNKKDVETLENLKKDFENNGFIVQIIRICSPSDDLLELEEKVDNKNIYLNIGQLPTKNVFEKLPDFYKSKNVSFNTELSDEVLELSHVNILFDIIKNSPDKTFNFTHTFNNVKSSPFFPSAVYDQDGFSIGLQSTDLSDSEFTLDAWFINMKKTWSEVNNIAKQHKGYLGIDSSIAPLFEGSSSIVNFVKRLGLTFSESILTDTYLKMTKFIKENNPKPIGLNGLMLPALEDFELALEYEKGFFSLERNIFLSLHSGLGIDTYPIGTNESYERVLNILKTVQGLSNKYKKPLAVRFVSDGKAKIGEMTDFKNKFLKDVIVKPL